MASTWRCIPPLSFDLPPDRATLDHPAGCANSNLASPGFDPKPDAFLEPCLKLVNNVTLGRQWFVQYAFSELWQRLDRSTTLEPLDRCLLVLPLVAIVVHTCCMFDETCEQWALDANSEIKSAFCCVLGGSDFGLRHP